MIQIHEERIKICQRQLQDHESGEVKLSRLMKTSTETSLEETQNLLQEAQLKLQELMQEDQRELDEKAQLEELLRRQIYLENQPDRIQNNKEFSEADRFEAVMLLDELPKEIWFEDEDLIEIASQIVKLNLRNIEDAFDKYLAIKAEFEAKVATLPEDKPKELGMLNAHIPIMVVHFWTLVEGIKTELIRREEEAKRAEEEARKAAEEARKAEEAKKAAEAKETEGENETKETEKNEETEAKDGTNNEIKEEIKIDEVENEAKEEQSVREKDVSFKGLPKYEDWWIRELWRSHQAYFGLFKWRAVVSHACITIEQKQAWSYIFDNWLMLKKLLSSKGSSAYEYNLFLDELLEKHVGLEEEFNVKNLKTMEVVLKRITTKEDFVTVVKGHSIITPYLKWKMDRIQRVEDENETSKNQEVDKKINRNKS